MYILRQLKLRGLNVLFSLLGSIAKHNVTRCLSTFAAFSTSPAHPQKYTSTTSIEENESQWQFQSKFKGIQIFIVIITYFLDLLGQLVN